MKLSLLSVDGLLITRLKTWVLRCHACFKISTILDKTFCPSCGNATLIRTSVGVDQSGKMKVFLKNNFQYKNRGTVYSIPAPKGGRHSNDLILREDQNEHQKALRLKKIYEKRALNRDLDIESLTMFGSAQINAAGAPIIGYGRKNPNEVRGRRRK